MSPVQCASKHRCECVEVGKAHVFEHSNRHERVVRTADVSVVVVDEGHSIGQMFARRPRPRVVQLLTRDVDGRDAHPVMPRHVQGQGAPATSGFDDRLARLQSQFAADPIELCALRHVERRLWRFEVRTGVHEFAVEPQSVEVVAEIVVMVHVPAGTAERVG